MALRTKQLEEQLGELKIENKFLKEQIEMQNEQNRVQNLLLQSGYSENPNTKYSLE